jgi:hypothetical protein
VVGRRVELEDGLTGRRLAVTPKRHLKRAWSRNGTKADRTRRYWPRG